LRRGLLTIEEKQTQPVTIIEIAYLFGGACKPTNFDNYYRNGINLVREISKNAGMYQNTTNS
jgi:hypothetical protein